VLLDISVKLERRPVRRTGLRSRNNLIHNKMKYVGMEFKKSEYLNKIYRSHQSYHIEKYRITNQTCL